MRRRNNDFKDIGVAFGRNCDPQQERRALSHFMKLAETGIICQDLSSFRLARARAEPTNAEVAAFDKALREAGFDLTAKILPPDLSTIDIILES